MPGRKRTLSMDTYDSAKRRRLNEDLSKFTETTQEIQRQIVINVSTDRFRIMAAHMKASNLVKEVLCNRSIIVNGFEIMVRLRGKRDDHSQAVYLAVEVAVQQVEKPPPKTTSRKTSAENGVDIPHFEFKCQMDPPSHKYVDTACGFHAINSGYWGRHKFVPLQNLCSMNKGEVTFTFDVSINMPISTQTQTFHSVDVKLPLIGGDEGPARKILALMLKRKLHVDLTIVAVQEEEDEERRRMDIEQGIESEVLCHKSVLSAASNVFEAMLSSNFVESQENRIEIEDFTPRTVHTMITYLYFGEHALENTEELFEWDKLFLISEKYQLTDLAKFSIRRMMKIVSTTTVENLVPCLASDQKCGDRSDSDSDSGSGPYSAPFNEARRLRKSKQKEERRERKRKIYESNFLFHLLNFLVQFPHVGWLNQMENSIFKLIEGPLKKLFEMHDTRFSNLPHDVLFKFFRDTMS